MKYLSFKKPSLLDSLIMFLYSLLITYIIYTVLNSNPREYFQSGFLVIGSSIFTQISLYIFVKHIRNATNLIYWILIGIIYFYLAYLLLTEYKINDKTEIGLGMMMNTLLMTCLLPLMRIYSLYHTKQEFIVPIRYAGLFDLVDQRESNIVDKLLNFIYLACFIGMPYLWILIV